MGWRKAKLLKANSFAVYYGYGCEEKLSSFDLAVVEPSGQSPATLKKIQAAGTLVLAYLSVMEIHPAAPEFQLLSEGDFITVEGRRLGNESFGAYLVDLRSKRWNGLLRHKAGGLLLQSGYDGLFLDTIGDVEFSQLSPALQDAQMMAAVSIIRELKKVAPECLIVQNNGLVKLCLLTAGLIDGICWENPPLAEQESLFWVRPLVERLKMLQDRAGLKVLLLMEEIQTTGQHYVKEAARENGFLFYLAPHNYLSI